MSLNNVIPAWVFNDDNGYVIIYEDGTTKLFYSQTPERAYQHAPTINPGKDILKILRKREYAEKP